MYFMPKTQEEKELLNGLHELLASFVAEKTPANDALDTIKLIYEQPNSPNLANILIQYRKKVAVFYPLIENIDNIDLMPLLIYFYEVNPEIIFIPLNDKDEGEASLLQLINEDEETYKELMDRILKDTPEILNAEKAFTFVVDNEKALFKELFKTLSSEDQIKTLQAINFRLMHLLLNYEENIEYLNTLIALNISILRLNLNGQTLLTSLCDDTKTYQSTLMLISTAYREELTMGEICQLDEVMNAATHASNEALEPTQSRAVTSTKIISPSFPLTQAQPSPPLLTLPEIDALALPNELAAQYDPLMPYINTKLWVDNLVLDVFLNRFRDQLAARGFALMPSINSEYPIDITQIHERLAQRPYEYTASISIDRGQMNPLMPILGTKNISQDMVWGVWPVNIHNIHYYLLVLELSPNAEHRRGFCIEPFSSEWMGAQMLIDLDEEARRHLQEEGQLIRSMRSYMYKTHVQQLTGDLNIAEKNFSYTYLSQSPDEDTCSDHVIALMALLANGSINLASDQRDPFGFLSGRQLCDATAKKIRMLQVKMLGLEYLRLQLPEACKSQPRLMMEIDQFEQELADNACRKHPLDEQEEPQEAKARSKRKFSWCTMFQETKTTETKTENLTLESADSSYNPSS